MFPVPHRLMTQSLGVTAALFAAAIRAWAEQQETAAPTRRIVVSLSDRKAVLVENGRVVKVYPVAVGAERTPSPVGSFTVAVRIPDPTWYGPKQVVAPGAANPLGTRWIGLSKKGYGIHGTNRPSSIGRAASHGCIRMRNRDVEELFERVAPGDSVELVDQVTPELAALFGAPAPVPAPQPAVLAAAAPQQPALSE